MTAKTANTTTIYEQAIDISRDYLGPAGERFMRKQIHTHLGKEPERLAKKDIVKLVTWVRPTFALLTSDTELINSFSERLLRLASTAASGHSH